MSHVVGQRFAGMIRRVPGLCLSTQMLYVVHVLSLVNVQFHMVVLLVVVVVDRKPALADQ
jgi:hypothetical protein